MKRGQEPEKSPKDHVLSSESEESPVLDAQSRVALHITGYLVSLTQFEPDSKLGIQCACVDSSTNICPNPKSYEKGTQRESIDLV